MLALIQKSFARMFQMFEVAAGQRRQQPVRDHAPRRVFLVQRARVTLGRSQSFIDQPAIIRFS